MGWKGRVGEALLAGASRLGVWRTVERLRPARLPVLAYHRVVGVSSPSLDDYMPNVSASPEAFREQMDHVRANFDVIDVDRLIRWLEDDGDLPARPLLITFDDGYRDNFESAYPVLRERGLAATLFVTTGFVGGSRPLYWDRAARGFERTRRTSLTVPGMGTLRWTGPRERARALREVIHGLKGLPDDEKERLLDSILDALEVGPDPEGARSLAMGWDEVREMAANGVSIGGHTHTHPILARLPLARARAEIATCLAVLEAEVKRPVRTFAYTNGLESDFGPPHERILEEMGVRAAFSLLPGPASRAEVRARPLAIRRILVHRRDGLRRFEAKLAGAARLGGDWL